MNIFAVVSPHKRFIYPISCLAGLAISLPWCCLLSQFLQWLCKVLDAVCSFQIYQCNLHILNICALNIIGLLTFFGGEGHYSALWRCLKCAELDVYTLIACIKLVGNTVIKFIEQTVNVFMFGRNLMCFLFSNEWFIHVKKRISINQGVFQLQPLSVWVGTGASITFCEPRLLLGIFHQSSFKPWSLLSYIMQIFKFSLSASKQT